MNPLWGDDWPAVRAAWSLDPDVAHLNHGSFGAVPLVVQDLQARVRTEAENNPNHFYAHLLMGRLEETRLAVADFLHTDLGGLAFVPNVTAGLSIALAAASLRPGVEVLITDHAYASARHAAEQACRRSGAEVVVARLGLPSPDATAAEAAEDWRRCLFAAVTPRTAVCVVDRIGSATGVCLPVAEWVRELRARGVLTVVDAAHVPGSLQETPESAGADIWVASLHKWPCAPRGTGVLVVDPGCRQRIDPLAPSSEPDTQFPDNLAWWGTTDYSAALAAPRALTLLDELGWDRVLAHNRALARLGGATVAGMLKTRVALNNDLFATMALVGLPTGIATDTTAARALATRVHGELHAEVAIAAWDGRGWLRLSAHVYNHPREYEALASGLVRLLG